MKRPALSLTELVVVLAIIAIFGLIAFPAFSRARESARELVCKNNLRQLNLALFDYVREAEIPRPDEAGGIGGWCVGILPLLEQNNLYDRIPIGSPVEDLPEDFFEPPSIFRCPTQEIVRSQSRDEIASGHYVLKTNEDRQVFIISDTPIEMSVPWVIGPEIPSLFERTGGPHNNGYYCVSGSTRGVQFREF